MPMTEAKRRREGSSDVEEVGMRELVSESDCKTAELVKEMKKVLREELLVEMRTEMREVMKEAIRETMKEVMKEVVREEMDRMMRTVKDLNGTVEKVEKKMDRLEHQMKGQTEECSVWEKRVVRMEAKIIDGEARSRRNNVVLYGVEEKGGREDCLEFVKDLFEGKCGVKANIDRAHRIPTGERQAGAKPRPLICHFVDFNERQAVKKAKYKLPRGIIAADDLPKEIRDARRQLKADFDQARAEKKDVFVAYPARLIVNNVEVKAIDPATMQTSRDATWRAGTA